MRTATLAHEDPELAALSGRVTMKTLPYEKNK
jgi:hypothetical protein